MRLSELASSWAASCTATVSVEIARVAPIESAGPGDLTFVANPALPALPRRLLGRRR